MAIVEAYLHGWPEKSRAEKSPKNLFLGRLFMERPAGRWQESVLTNFLQEDLHSFRIEIRSGRDKIIVEDIHLYLLETVQQDGLKQKGGAW